MEQLLRKACLLGLGAMVLTREKAEQLLSDLARSSEVLTGQQTDAVSELLSKGEKGRDRLESRLAEELAGVLAHTNLATKDDVKRLERKIDELKRAMKS